MQPAFKVRKHHRHRFDTLLFPKVIQTLFLNNLRRHALFALFLHCQVHLFQF